MRLYLDTSVFNRPFDDQTQPRIWLETLALALILQLIESGEATLVNSSVLEFENSQNPFTIRQDWVSRCCELATIYQRVNVSIYRRAEALEKKNIHAIDALHVACAEMSGADYFLTCDDRLLRRQKHFNVNSMNPLDFVQKVMGEHP